MEKLVIHFVSQLNLEILSEFETFLLQLMVQDHLQNVPSLMGLFVEEMVAEVFLSGHPETEVVTLTTAIVTDIQTQYLHFQ